MKFEFKLYFENLHANCPRYHNQVTGGVYVRQECSVKFIGLVLPSISASMNLTRGL